MTESRPKSDGSKHKLTKAGKRAAHVKWRDKTINLGFFPNDEIDNISRCAKILTKKWRSMTPKPNIEWVKKELENRGIRVTSRKPGRHAKRVSSNRDKLVSSNPRSESVEMSFAQQIPVTNPHSLVDETVHFHTDQAINVVKEKETFYHNRVQAHSPASVVVNLPYSIAKNIPSEFVQVSEPLSEIGQSRAPLQAKSDQWTALLPTEYKNHPLDLQRRASDSCLDVSRTTRITTESQVEDRVAGLFAHSDLDELDIEEKRYAILKIRHSKLEKERKGVMLLMDYYKNKRLWQLLQKHHNKRKRKIQINDQVGMQISPIAIDQVSHDPQTHQHSHIPTEFDKQRETSDLADHENAIMSIIPEDWKY